MTRYLAEATLERFTRRTITSPEALRAELVRVRTQGWALVDQELEEGIRSVAAPVHDRTGRVVAAVNVSSQAGRRTLDAMRSDLLPPLLEAAAGIARDLALTPRAEGGAR